MIFRTMSERRYSHCATSGRNHHYLAISLSSIEGSSRNSRPPTPHTPPQRAFHCRPGEPWKMRLRCRDSGGLMRTHHLVCCGCGGVQRRAVLVWVSRRKTESSARPDQTCSWSPVSTQRSRRMIDEQKSQLPRPAPACKCSAER
jgi:hypothetical protein